MLPIIEHAQPLVNYNTLSLHLTPAAAQRLGEVAGHGQRGPKKDLADDKVFFPDADERTGKLHVSDIGLRYDEIHEARAKVRLADEYDLAQERGEVFGPHNGAKNRVPEGNAISSTEDISIRRKEIHEARQLRDAEAEQPGKIEAAAKAILGMGFFQKSLNQRLGGSFVRGRDSRAIPCLAQSQA